MTDRITVIAGDREFPGALAGTRLTCLACQAGEALKEGAGLEIGGQHWRVASVRDPYALTEDEARQTIIGRSGTASRPAVAQMLAVAKKDAGKFLQAYLEPAEELG